MPIRKARTRQPVLSQIVFDSTTIPRNLGKTVDGTMVIRLHPREAFPLGQVP